MTTNTVDSQPPVSHALYVPRLLRSAELACADGRILRGRIFLPAAAVSHAGAVRVAEWLEDAAPFFPFLPDGDGRPVLLSKLQLIVVTVAAADDPEPPAEAESVPRRLIAVDCGVLRVQGDVAIDMPASHSRVLDVLNRPGEFLMLRSGVHHQFVRKSRIVRVVESGAPRA